MHGRLRKRLVLTCLCLFASCLAAQVRDTITPTPSQTTASPVLPDRNAEPDIWVRLRLLPSNGGVLLRGGRYRITLAFAPSPEIIAGGASIEVSSSQLQGDDTERAELTGIVMLDPSVFASQSDREVAFQKGSPACRESICPMTATPAGDPDGKTSAQAANVLVQKHAPPGPSVISVVILYNSSVLGEATIPVYVSDGSADTRVTLPPATSLFRAGNEARDTTLFAGPAATLSLVELHDNQALGVFCERPIPCRYWRFATGEKPLAKWLLSFSASLGSDTGRSSVGRKLINAMFPPDADEARCPSASCNDSRAAFMLWVQKAIATARSPMPILVSQVFRLHFDTVRAPVVIPLGILPASDVADNDENTERKPQEADAAIPNDLVHPDRRPESPNPYIEHAESEAFLAYHALLITRVYEPPRVGLAAGRCVSTWALCLPTDSDPLKILPKALAEVASPEQLAALTDLSIKHADKFRLMRSLRSLENQRTEGLIVLSHFDQELSELFLYQSGEKESLTGADVEHGTGRPSLVMLFACNTGSADDNDVVRAFGDHGTMAFILTAAPFLGEAAGAYVHTLLATLRQVGTKGDTLADIFHVTGDSMPAYYRAWVSRLSLIGDPSLRLCGPVEGE